MPWFRYKIYDLECLHQTPFVTALRNIFALLETCHANISTMELTKAFGWDASEALVQHDAHEMVQQLFNSLETCMKGTAQEAFIRDVFSGFIVFRSRTVDASNYTSDRLQLFYDVELVVKDKNTIVESLNELVTPETIDDVSIELTPGAKPTRHRIERLQRFYKLPPVLLIHPNRAAFDMETGSFVTLNNRWEFDVNLDLRSFMINEEELRLDKESASGAETAGQPSGHNPTTQPVDSATPSSSPCGRSTIAGLLPNKPMGTQYKLRSILTHAGDMSMGHYYTYVRFENCWMRFNDEFVTEAPYEEVQRSVFGENVNNSSTSDYRRERASLLVYVNADCEAEMLREVPTPESIQQLARSLEETHIVPLSTPLRHGDHIPDSITYVHCENLHDIFDEVPHTHKLLRKAPIANVDSVRSIYEAVAADLRVPRERLRLLVFPSRSRAGDYGSNDSDSSTGSNTYSDRNSPSATPRMAHTLSNASSEPSPYACLEALKHRSQNWSSGCVAQVYPSTPPSSSASPFFALVRRLSTGEVTKYETFLAHSREMLESIVRSTMPTADADELPDMFLVTLLPLRVRRIHSVTVIPDGANVIVSGRHISSSDVEQLLRARQFPQVELTLLNPIDRSVRKVLTTVALNPSTMYSVMQEYAFNYIRRNMPQLIANVRTADYIGLHTCLTDSGKVSVLPEDSLTHDYDDNVREIDVRRLLEHRDSVSALYFSILPLPLSQTNLHTQVRINLDLCRQPVVYLHRKWVKITMGELMIKAAQQLQGQVDQKVIDRLTTPQDRTSEPTMRALRVSMCRIMKILEDEDALIDLTEPSEWVLDLLTPTPPGYERIDVLFCTRRSSEVYYGLPTHIIVHKSMQETGLVLLQRVAKRLGVRDLAEVEKRWLISVKSSRGSAIRTAGKKDILANLVAEIKGAPYHFLVDRPQLKGDDGCDQSRREHAIVIKSASATDVTTSHV